MSAVPTYALYGEADHTAYANWLHCESIPARSALFDWEIGLHRHQHFFQILNMTRGQGEARLGSRSVPLGPGMAVTVTPGIVHGFRFSPDTEGHVITLLGEQVNRILAPGSGLQGLLTEPQAIALGEAAPEVERNMAAVAREFPGSAPGRLGLIEAHIGILLITLGRLAAETAEQGEAAPNRTARYAMQFRILLDQMFRMERSVAFYAERLGISEVHLNRVCRAALKTSALGAISQRIVLEATRDLTFTVLSVKEIAYSLGFDDPAYFTRFFTRQTGLTPTQFRKRNAA